MQNLRSGYLENSCNLLKLQAILNLFLRYLAPKDTFLTALSQLIKWLRNKTYVWDNVANFNTIPHNLHEDPEENNDIL